MQVVLESIRSLLEENRSVETNSIRVRFLRFGSYSLDVEVYAYVKARDWNQFLELQEGLLLGIMKCIESAGVEISLPSQSLFLTTTPPDDRTRRPLELSEASTPEDKTIDLTSKSA